MDTSFASAARAAVRRLGPGRGRRRSQQLMGRVAQSAAGHAIFWLDADGWVVTWNRGAEQMSGYGAEEVIGRPLSRLLAAEDRAPLTGALAAAGPGDHQQLEGRWLRPTGAVFCVSSTITAVGRADGQVEGFAVVAQDVSDRERLRDELEENALRDPLTGLANRRRFLDHVNLSLARLDREAATVAVLFIDLDRTKVINDSLGHEAGDQLLASVAERLGTAIRASDTLARFGGDEFTVLCPDVAEGPGGAVRIAERILAVLKEPFTVAGRAVFVGASVGVALATNGTETAEELVRDADAAMYRAKAAGGGRYELFDEAMRRAALRRLEVEAELRQALARGEFQLHYQPLARVGDGEVEGVEALLRWHHPVRGLIPPEEFLSVAEETGVIVPLGTWVLRQACRQAAAWAVGPEGPLRVNVNVSARQLSSGDLPAVVARTLTSTAVDPALIELELTETAVMGNTDTTIATLEALHALGVSIAIDDFGTGYSSLTHLRRLPIDRLKIDRSFVAGLGRDPGDTAIVAAVIRMAGVLGLEVVAEGVETADQLNELRALGCTFGQGFFFSRPQAPEALRATLEAWPHRVDAPEGR